MNTYFLSLVPKFVQEIFFKIDKTNLYLSLIYSCVLKSSRGGIYKIYDMFYDYITSCL